MNAAQINAIAILLLGGMRPSEIIAAINLPGAYVRKVRRELDIPPFPSGRKPGENWKPDVISTVRKLRAQGKSTSEIAAELGIAQQRVTQLLAPLKHRARAAVARAIEAGEIVRPELCQDCGQPGPVEAHHKDYTKPLEVEFLCIACHGLRRIPLQPAA